MLSLSVHPGYIFLETKLLVKWTCSAIFKICNYTTPTYCEPQTTQPLPPTVMNLHSISCVAACGVCCREVWSKEEGLTGEAGRGGESAAPDSPSGSSPLIPTLSVGQGNFPEMHSFQIQK